jgi:hypothetical protein
VRRDAETARLSKLESRNASLCALYDTMYRTHPPVLLVDG